MSSHNAFRDDPADNPYLPPAELASAHVPRPPHANSLIAWERLRLAYNGVLILVVLLARVLLLGSPTSGFWLRAAEGAIIANVCFCVGPVAEFYLHLIRLRGPYVRGSLFVLGTLFAVLLAMGTLVGLGGI